MATVGATITAEVITVAVIMVVTIITTTIHPADLVLHTPLITDVFPEGMLMEEAALQITQAADRLQEGRLMQAEDLLSIRPDLIAAETVQAL
jgi:hypothetical protein